MASSVTIIGDKELTRKLTVFANNIKSPKKALKKTGDMLVDNYVENFKTEGKTLEAPWKPLSTATQIAKIQSGFGGAGILKKTGKLMKSIKILQLTKFLVKIGSNNPYYKYHQSSASRSSNLPRRKMVDITKKLAKKVTSTLREFLIIPLLK